MKTTHLAEQTRLSDIFKGTFYWNYPWFDPQGRQKVFCKKSWIKKGKISKRLTKLEIPPPISCLIILCT